MFAFTRRHKLAALLAAALFFTACAPLEIGLEPQATVVVETRAAPPVQSPTQPAAPTAAAPSATPAPASTAAADPAALCPQPGAGQALYSSPENGYCFLYPSTFTTEPDFLRPAYGIGLNGPSVTRGMDTVAVHLSVFANGPADGLDSQSYSAKWLKAYRMDPNAPTQPLSVNGQAAVLIDNLPGGMFNQRQAFIVAGGFKYQLTLSPQPGTEQELTEATNQVWDLMMQSLTLFPPARPLPLARPDEICPKAGADTKLLVDEAQGYCLLYPADFEMNPDFPGQIIGGPVLADLPDWGKIRTNLTIAGYDQPPATQLTPPEVNVDTSTIRPITVGGWPGLVYEFTSGPWLQHTIEVLANGSRYTLVGPLDAQRFPNGFEDAQRLWNTVVESLVFFEKWR